MSILTAIVQAILQALTFVFPVSESGHSAIFHDFAGRTSGTCSAITGVIHIGIAVGIFIAMFKLFVALFKQVIATFSDIFKKNLKGSSKSPARSFMYMTLVSFVPMILWLIPTKKGFFYSILRSTGHNGTLLDEGLFFVALGVLVFISAKMLELNKNTKPVTLLSAIAVGVFSLLLVPMAGLSPVFGVFAVLLLFGVSKRNAFRYTFVIAFPVLIIMGIIEICVSVTPAGIFASILAIVISAAVTFVSIRVLRWVINTAKLKYFSYYDISIGVIALIVGLFEIIF